MRSYLSVFKLKFITNLQYRASALSGMITQIFFGIVFIMMYLAFYESNSTTGVIKFSQLVTYIWLQQGFFALIYLNYKDKDIIKMIKSGDIAYELCRPQNIYIKWYAKIFAAKIADVTLRIVPLIIFALLLPSPYNLSLPHSYISFGLFLIAIILTTFLTIAFITLYHILVFYTLEADGVVSMFVLASEILSGIVVPLFLFPDFIRKIVELLPFRYIADLPFRIYSNNIPSSSCLGYFIQEIIWIILIVMLGYILTKNATKKVVVQGG